jgi:predicted O-methyltransferase YrrM
MASSAVFITHLPLSKSKYQSPRSLAPNFMSPSLSTSRVIANCPELGGDIIRIRAGPEDEDTTAFLTALGVPTFAVDASTNHSFSSHHPLDAILPSTKPRRMGLEGILRNSNAFVLENALSPEACEHILNTCEYELKFGRYNAGKNNHGALQIVTSRDVADALMRIIGPHIDLEGVIDADRELRDEETKNDEAIRDNDISYALAGINRRLRIYRYAPDRNEKFAPHIDAGFPPGGVSSDDDDHDDSLPFLHWDASHQYPSKSDVVSRLTVLIYLNDDFCGGHTKFYEPMAEKSDNNACNVIASIKPRTGSILVFPQAVSESAVERARCVWPLHEGSPVTFGKRPKYVIRTDVLFESITNNASVPEEDKILFQHDGAVRNVFLNVSPMFSTLFLHHVHPLYNPHMGVENVGPLIYSFVRFVKSRQIVEIGAGYTTLYLLQALKDNEEEMRRVLDLELDGRLRLLDYPFGTPRLKEWSPSSSANPSSSLLCIDNCEHQRETASSAVNVARTLGLDQYLNFLKGDAFDALETHFPEVESIDLLWCDFGVGARMRDYVSKVWRFIRPGGFLLCHSTLTNARTREWLEAVRQRKGEVETGIPVDGCTELSLLEPHKRFQNSMTILQKRQRFEEPIYSEHA